VLQVRAPILDRLKEVLVSLLLVSMIHVRLPRTSLQYTTKKLLCAMIRACPEVLTTTFRTTQ